jgi:pyruvate/2-oxoglutarate/acetoin dehydrogenase E1 component
MRHAAARNRLIRDGILRAIYVRMKADPRVILVGEGALVKTFYDCRAIHDEMPERVLTLPISEDSNTNFAVGLSIGGLTPCVDVITCDFLLRTMDSIANTAAKQATVDEARTIVIRAEHLTGGVTTGQRFEALFARTPGLSVVVPSNPVDACGLMLTALQHQGVTVFFEDREIEDSIFKDDEYLAYGDPTGDVPFGKAARRAYRPHKKPAEVTIVTYGLCVNRAWEAMNEKHVPADVLDLRTLYPLDMQTILDSVRRTRRLLVVEPAIQFCGIGAEIVAAVVEAEPGVRVARLGGARKTLPAAREWFDGLYPSAEQVLAAAERLCQNESAWLT